MQDSRGPIRQRAGGRDVGKQRRRKTACPSSSSSAPTFLPPYSSTYLSLTSYTNVTYLATMPLFVPCLGPFQPHLCSSLPSLPSLQSWAGREGGRIQVARWPHLPALDSPTYHSRCPHTVPWLCLCHSGLDSWTSLPNPVGISFPSLTMPWCEPLHLGLLHQTLRSSSKDISRSGA